MKMAECVWPRLVRCFSDTDDEGSENDDVRTQRFSWKQEGYLEGAGTTKPGMICKAKVE